MLRLRDHLRTIVEKEMRQDSAHDLAHLDRVWVNVQQIAAKEPGADLRILLAASYLHDLVNLPKDSKIRKNASVLSAQKAKPFLIQLGFPEPAVVAVEHAIAAHSFSAGIAPASLEAAILRDADRLDALGAIGIARTFMVAGAQDRPICDPQDPFAKSRPLDDQAWSIDHWHVKLLQLPKDMLTETGRKIAERRAQMMISYLEVLAEEMGVSLPQFWTQLHDEGRP